MSILQYNFCRLYILYETCTLSIIVSQYCVSEVLYVHISSAACVPLQGIPKLDDANEAGGRHSHDCTLILTEGDSAKTLAVSGLGVVGRDHYGVFPLRGKLLNVREASHNQVRRHIHSHIV